MIRRVDGRDRRVVHVDRLQRYDKVVLDDINFTSRPRLEGDKLTDQSRPEGDKLTRRPNLDGDILRKQRMLYDNISTNQQPPTTVAAETSAVIGRSQRQRVKPWKFGVCRQLCRRSWWDEVSIAEMHYQCAQCTCEFGSRSG